MPRLTRRGSNSSLPNGTPPRLCIGAYAVPATSPASFDELLAGVSPLEILIAAIVPAVPLGTMASLGVGRSGLAALEEK